MNVTMGTWCLAQNTGVEKPRPLKRCKSTLMPQAWNFLLVDILTRDVTSYSQKPSASLTYDEAAWISLSRTSSCSHVQPLSPPCTKKTSSLSARSNACSFDFSIHSYYTRTSISNQNDFRFSIANWQGGWSGKRGRGKKWGIGYNSSTRGEGGKREI